MLMLDIYISDEARRMRMPVESTWRRCEEMRKKDTTAKYGEREGLKKEVKAQWPSEDIDVPLDLPGVDKSIVGIPL